MVHPHPPDQHSDVSGHATKKALVPVLVLFIELCVVYNLKTTIIVDGPGAATRDVDSTVA